MITTTELTKMAIGKPNAANMKSLQKALETYGAKVGLDRPHRLAHFLPQVMHESGDFRYDKEIWGPTPAQKRYEGRKNLGNTSPGDGKKFMGRGPIQLTGKDNVRRFTAWARKLDPKAPDFVKNPELINTDPWEGLSAIWYWDEGNPERKSLNRYADQNNIEMVTRRINGGLNGFADRVNRYGRTALVMLGYGTSAAEVKRFQKDHPETGNADGVVGQNTRMALHKALAGANPYETTVEVETEVEVDKPTVPQKVDEKVKQKTNFWQWLMGVFSSGALSLGWLGGMDYQAILAIGGVVIAAMLMVLVLRHQILGAVKDIRDTVESE